MATAIETAQQARVWTLSFPRWLRTFPVLFIGLFLLLAVVLVGLIGPFFIEREAVNVGSALPDQKPSREYLLGTDTVGRQMLAIIVYGTPLTLRIGLIAGLIGLTVG